MYVPSRPVSSTPTEVAHLYERPKSTPLVSTVERLWARVSNSAPIDAKSLMPNGLIYPGVRASCCTSDSGGFLCTIAGPRLDSSLSALKRLMILDGVVIRLLKCAL